jgi:hypothetical protein
MTGGASWLENITHRLAIYLTTTPSLDRVGRVTVNNRSLRSKALKIRHVCSMYTFEGQRERREKKYQSARCPSPLM